MEMSYLFNVIYVDAEVDMQVENGYQNDLFQEIRRLNHTGFNVLGYGSIVLRVNIP